MGYQKKYKKFVATAATATLVASAIVPVASAKSFSDVAENNEFQPFIDALSDAGIINGYQDGTFKPGNKLTRGQVVKMLGRWVEANGQEIPADWNSVQRFNDVPTNSADEELVKYAALVKDAGVFTGSNGNLMAGNNITRQQMAKVLNGAYTAINGFSLVDLADSIDNKLVTDLASAQQEFEGYIQALVDLEISTVSVFRPTENVTRAQFAKFLYNTINLEVVDAVGVKAINNTTVEVTFEDAIDNIKDIDFTIEGLKVENAVVKQTDKNTAVLTTAAQEGGKEYTVTVDGEKVGSFKGIAAVIPTNITTTTTSVQGVIGEQVTVKAQVAVAEGQSKENVPVTFNIVNDVRTNDKIEVEVLTNAEGVATYSYTRYYDSADMVTAYATKKSSVHDDAKVYWAKKIQLAVSEITTGNELANQTKKSYKVTGEKNKTYYVAIKENLNVAPDKVTKVQVQDHSSANFTTPYELTTGATQFAKVTTNSNGEGTFTVFGSNLSATPIVYLPETTPAPTNATTVEKEKYNKLDLQAQAPTVKFSQIDRLALTVKAEGTADSAAVAVDVPGLQNKLNAGTAVYNETSVGGRTYTVTVTDKEGKLAPEGTVAYVTFETGNYSIVKNNVKSGELYFSTGEEKFQSIFLNKEKGEVKVLPIKVGKDGKAQFRVAGIGDTTFAKPTVFLNTAGSTLTNQIKLDKTGSATDIHQVAEATYFKAPVVTNAVLTVTDKYERVITSLNTEQDALFTYQSVDQNGFAYRPTGYKTQATTQTLLVPVYGKDANGNQVIVGYKQETVTINPGSTATNKYVLAFDVTSTFGDATVKDAVTNATLPVVQNLGNTKTYHVESDASGKAVVRITSTKADTVSVNVTGASNILPTKTASVSFVNSTIVPDSYSGVVESYNSNKGTLKFQGKQQEVKLFGSDIRYTKDNQVVANYDAFIKLLADANGPVSITRIVKDGVTTFNIYNIATTTDPTKDQGPTDTATTTVNKVTLQTTVDAETTANLQATNYTPATWTVYETALKNARAVLANTAATQTEVDAALTALTTAKAGLAPAATALEGVVITAANGLAPSETAGLLGLFSGYEVSGTVANSAITTVTLTYTFDNATATPLTKTVNVVNGAFSDTLGKQTYSVKSVTVTSPQATGSVSKDITTKKVTN